MPATPAGALLQRVRLCSTRRAGLPRVPGKTHEAKLEMQKEHAAQLNALQSRPADERPLGTRRE